MIGLHCSKSRNIVLPDQYRKEIFNTFKEIPKQVFTILTNLNGVTSDEIEQIERLSGNTMLKFVVVYEGSLPKLFFPIQFLEVTNKNITYKRSGLWNKFLNCHFKISYLKFLFPGNFFRFDRDYLFFQPQLSSYGEAHELLINTLKGLENNFSGYSILYKAPITLTNELDEVLRELEFESPIPDISMQLNIDPQWLGFDEYCNALSKKYLARARKIKQASSSLKIMELNLDVINKYQNEIHSLYLQTISKQDLVLAKAPVGYFYELKQKYGRHFHLKGFFKDNTLVAFYTWFDLGETLEMHYVGIDYVFNTEFQLYFNILFAGMLDAIENKKKCVCYGRTSLDAKASLGATALPSSTYVKFNEVNPVVKGQIFDFFNNNIQQEWQHRNPFKENKAQKNSDLVS